MNSYLLKRGMKIYRLWILDAFVFGFILVCMIGCKILENGCSLKQKKPYIDGVLNKIIFLRLSQEIIQQQNMKAEPTTVTEYLIQFSTQQSLKHLLQKLPEHFANYQPQSFWNFFKGELGQGIRPETIFHLYVKLMNEEVLRVIGHKDYEFLLLGQRMKEQKRRDFIENKDEMIRYELYNLIDLWGKEKLPQFHLYHALFVDESSLTLEILLQHISDPAMRIKIRQRLQHEKENDKDGRKFDIGPRLTEKEIKIILEIMIPINIVVLRMLMDKLLKKEHFSSVADRVVVVFVGETGVGKSTLILYLLGYQLQLVIVPNQLSQTVPVGEIKQQHKMIVSQQSIVSVTNSIHFVQFPEKRVILADTPGTEDTRGATRKAFNILLRNLMYKTCKQLKIVELIDTKLLLVDRVGGLKKLTTRITENYEFDDSIELSERLTVILNKCSNDLREIQHLRGLLNLAKGQTEVNFTRKELEVINFLIIALQPGEEGVEVAIPQNFYELKGKRQQLLSLLDRKLVNNPADIIRKSLEPTLRDAIETTLKYYFNNTKQWLKKEQIKIVKNYYQKYHTLDSIFPSGDQLKQLDDCIKEHFSTHFKSFTSIIHEKCEKIYREEDFNQLRNHLRQLTEAEIFKEYFRQQIKTAESLEVAKKELLASYRAKMKEGKCNQQLIENFRQFLKLFEEKQDPSVLLIASSQQYSNRIEAILQNGGDYKEIDDAYQAVIDIDNNIKNLNPLYEGFLGPQLKDSLTKKIQEDFKKLEEMQRNELDLLKIPSDLAVYFANEPMLHEISINKLLQNYKQYKKSSLMAEIMKSYDEDPLMNTFFEELFKLIQEYKHLLRQEQNCKINVTIIQNFRMFIKPYFQISSLNKALSSCLEELNQQILIDSEQIHKKLNHFQQKFLTMMGTNDKWPQLKLQASKVQQMHYKQTLYSEHLQKGFKSTQFYQTLSTKLEALYSLLNLVKQKQEKVYLEEELFLNAIDKYDKIQKVKQFLPQLQQKFIYCSQQLTKYFDQIVNCIEQQLHLNVRTEKLLQRITGVSKEKQLKNVLNAISFILPKLQDVNYSQKARKVYEKQGEIFKNCETLTKWRISFHLNPSMYELDAHQEIFIGNYFDLFAFLNDLLEIPFFLQLFKVNDLRGKILARLTSELKAIKVEIQKRIRERNQSSYYQIHAKLYRLEQIQKLTLNEGQSNPNLSKQIEQLKLKLREVETLANNNDPEYKQIKPFVINDYGSEQVAYRDFISYYSKENGKGINSQMAFSIFSFYIKQKLDKKQLNLIENPDKLIKNLYGDLKKIQIGLQQRSLTIIELDHFVESLQSSLKEILEKYYQEAHKLYLIKEIKEAEKRLKEIEKITKSICNRRIPLPNIPIFQSIEALKKNIQAKSLEIQKIRQKFASPHQRISLYDNFDQIILYACNGIFPEIKGQVQNLLSTEIDAISNTHNHKQNFDGYGHKFQILKMFIDELFIRDEQRRTIMTSRLKEGESNIKKMLQKHIEKRSELIKQSYALLMDYIYQSKKFCMYEYHQLQNDKRDFLQTLNQKLKNPSNNVSSIFSILTEHFWVNDVSKCILEEFHAENVQHELKFIRCLVKDRINPEIEKFSKELGSKKQDLLFEINRHVIEQFFLQLRKNSERFYNPNLFENIKSEVLQALQAVRCKYSCRYERILNIKKCNDFKQIRDEIRFGSSYERLNEIIKHINPTQELKPSKVHQFQQKLAKDYNQVVHFDINSNYMRRFRSSLKMEIIFESLSSKIRLISSCPASIKHYNVNFKEQQQTISHINDSANFKEQLSHRLQNRLNLNNYLENFIMTHHQQKPFSLKQLIKCIQIENITLTITKISQSNKLNLSLPESSFAKISLHLSKISPKKLVSSKTARIIEEMIRLKKISLFLNVQASKCEELINIISAKVCNPAFHLFNHFRDTIENDKSISPLHNCIISYLQRHNLKIYSPLIETPCSVVRMYNFYRLNLGSSIQDSQDIYLKRFDSYQLSNQFLVLLAIFSWLYPFIQFHPLSSVFKVAEEIYKCSSITQFSLGKFIQASWKEKNIIMMIIAALLRLKNYEVYLIYANDEKRSFEMEKYQNFHRLIEMRENFNKNNRLIYTTYEKLFNDYTQDMKFEEDIEDTLLTYEGRERMNTDQSKQKVFIFEDYHEVFSEELLTKMYAYRRTLNQHAFLSQVCEILAKSEEKDVEILLQKVKKSKKYEEVITNNKNFARIIDLQIKKLIKTSLNYQFQYEVANQCIYRHVKGKPINALLLQDQKYQLLLAYYKEYKLNNVSFANFYDSSTINVKLYEISFHKFIHHLSQKYKLIGFTLEGKCNMHSLSKECMKIENADVRSHEKRVVRISKQINLQKQPSIMLQSSNMTIVLFQDYRGIKQYMKSNNLYDLQQKQKIQVIDERMDPHIIKIKLRTLPFFKQSALMSFQAIKMLSSMEEFYRIIGKTVILLRFLPKTEVEYAQIEPTLAFICEQYEIFLSYSNEKEHANYKQKIIELENSNVKIGNQILEIIQQQRSHESIQTLFTKNIEKIVQGALNLTLSQQRKQTL